VPTLPRQNWILGSLRPLLKDPLLFLDHARETAGPNFCFRLLTKKVWVFSEPKLVHQVFFESAKCLEKSAQRAAFGKSVLTSDGEDWKRMRRSVAPFFNKDRIEDFGPLMHAYSKAAAREAAASGKIELYEFLGKLVNDIIVSVLFGQKNIGSTPDLRRPMEALTDYVMKFSALPFAMPEWVPLRIVQEKRRAVVMFDQLMEEFLKNPPAKGEKISFLESLSRSGEVPKEEMHTQCLAFYLAGFETTANSLFWTFLEILRDPELQSDLRAEARAALLSTNFKTEDLELKLPLLRSVLSESLRICPPIWFRTRIAQAPFEMGGAQIQKGDLVWVSPYLNQRSPDAWKNPAEFQARRFLGKPWPKDPTYYPFSMALNTCTGKDFAWLEMLIVVATVLAEVELSPAGSLPQPYPRKTRVSVRPDQELWTVSRSVV
jgi:cytochrome P450